MLLYGLEIDVLQVGNNFVEGRIRLLLAVNVDQYTAGEQTRRYDLIFLVVLRQLVSCDNLLPHQALQIGGQSERLTRQDHITEMNDSQLPTKIAHVSDDVCRQNHNDARANLT